MPSGSKPGEHRGGRKKGTANRLPTLRQIKDQAAEKQGVTAELVVRELRRIAFADARKLMSWGPNGVTLIDSSKISADDAAAVSETSESYSDKGGSIKLKMHDKLAALDKLGRFLGIFADTVEHTGSGGGPIAQEIVVRRLDR